MTEENAQSSPQRPFVPLESAASVEEDSRYCWVCFGTDEEDETAEWVQPCNCRGTTKWVHEECVQRWVDEKLKGNISGQVCCPQCNTQYILEYPDMGCVVYFLDTVDNLIYKICPFVAAGLIVGSLYWSAVSYGAVTVMQIIGHKDGMAMLEESDPLILLIGLPTIPVMLVLAKMVRWEDGVLALLRRYAHKVPILRHMFPSRRVDTRESTDVPPLSDPVSATKVICGALILPSVAALVGKLFFDYIPSRFKRSLFGGLMFIAGKGVLKIYHKQQQLVRMSNRKIYDYGSDNASNSDTW